jgi:hypothetical protein
MKTGYTMYIDVKRGTVIAIFSSIHRMKGNKISNSGHLSIQTLIQ